MITEKLEGLSESGLAIADKYLAVMIIMCEEKGQTLGPLQIHLSPWSSPIISLWSAFQVTGLCLCSLPQDTFYRHCSDLIPKKGT